MLVQINPPATETNSVIVLHPSDSVGWLACPFPPDKSWRRRASGSPPAQTIPAGHKIALVPIRAGDAGASLRRNYRIRFAGYCARATTSTNTILASRNWTIRYTFDTKPATPAQSTRSFLGFRRADGRVGTRNYIAVVATSNCAAHAVELVEKSFLGERLPPQVDGIVSFPHGDGCGQAMGADTRQLQRTLEGVLDHPNVAAAVVIGLGCEVNQIDHYLGEANGTARSKSLMGLTLQESGGTRSVVEQARRNVRTLLEQTASTSRVEVPASALVLGLNCGGSDSFSGITANPALGLLFRPAGTRRRHRGAGRDHRDLRRRASAAAPGAQ